MEIKDKNGKVLSEEEVQALIAKTETVVEELANEKQSKANLVSEIKQVRERAQTAEEKLKLTEKPEPATPAAPDVKDTIISVLDERLSVEAQKRAKENRETALAMFKDEHSEFHPDNDPGGVKFAAFEATLKQFNTDDIKDVDGYMNLFDSAVLLMKRPEQKNSFRNPYSSTPSNPSSTIRISDPNQLSAKELKIIQDSFGGDKARYLKIKPKRPEYVKTLLQYVD